MLLGLLGLFVLDVMRVVLVLADEDSRPPTRKVDARSTE